MEKELIEIIKDYIQDTRINIGTEIKYETLINALVESTGLNYNKNDLIIDEGTALITILKSLEPEEYKKKFAELLEEEREINDEIPF